MCREILFYFVLPRVFSLPNLTWLVLPKEKEKNHVARQRRNLPRRLFLDKARPKLQATGRPHWFAVYREGWSSPPGKSRVPVYQSLTDKPKGSGQPIRTRGGNERAVEGA